jgi:disulfide bond formation protein DsbB
MEKIRSLINSPRPFQLLIVVIFLSLGTAYIAQYGYNLLPCPLCMYQRYTYFMMLPIAIIGIFKNDNPRLVNFLLSLCVILGVITAFVALYQFFVEQGIFEGTSTCSAEFKAGSDLKTQIMNNPIASCQAASWRVFGLPITFLHALWSFGWSMLVLVMVFINKSEKESKSYGNKKKPSR